MNFGLTFVTLADGIGGRHGFGFFMAAGFTIGMVMGIGLGQQP
ncbi:hypothetical protein [Paenibacillus sp. MER TA 81-3]|nr:hypothetical protein [Paenibacillus sp. MER TA 81-3]